MVGILRGIGLALALALQPAASSAGDSTAAAMAVMDRFLIAFNARDVNAWADTLHFPHVRLAGGTVTVYPDRNAFVAAMRPQLLVEAEGWDHSTWDVRDVVQASPQKVHIATVFSRYHADGTRYATYQSLYVVELVNGRWGIRARSSFAP